MISKPMVYSTSIWPLLAVGISLLGTIPIMLSGRKPNLRESWTLLIAIGKFLLVASMLPTVLAGGSFTFTIAEVFPGVPIALRVDAMGMFFALVASFLWICTSAYSIGYMRALDEHGQTRYYAAFALAISATIGVAFSANLLHPLPVLRSAEPVDLPAGHPRAKRRGALLRPQIPDLHPRHLHRPGSAGDADHLLSRRHP
jgi:hypothetical protein